MLGINALTIDLEPWLSRVYELHPRKNIEEVTLLRATFELLDVFELYDVNATFFVLGSVYDHYPSLIDEIASRGHEIAFHGHYHDVDLPLKRHIDLSQNFISKYKVKGFRSPRMKITLEGIKSLCQAHFSYDSSTYAPFPTSVKVGNLWEVPVSTYPLRNRTPPPSFPRSFSDAVKNFEIPFGCGMVMGVLGTRIVDHYIQKFNQRGIPVILFIHQWQVSDLLKLMKKIPISEWYNIVRGSSLRDLCSVVRVTRENLEYLLKNHTFVCIKALLNEVKGDRKDSDLI